MPHTAYVGLGANLPSPRFGSPRETLTAALGVLADSGVAVTGRSRWYQTQPVPASDQPLYVNAVAQVKTELEPLPLLERLLAIETELGRVRGERWAARVIDLDLLAVEDRIIGAAGTGGRLVLPHPSLHERAFVLAPLVDLAPAWRHPLLGRTAAELLAGLSFGERASVAPLRQA